MRKWWGRRPWVADRDTDEQEQREALWGNYWEKGLKAAVLRYTRYENLVKCVGGFCWGTEKTLTFKRCWRTAESSCIFCCVTGMWWNAAARGKRTVDYLHSIYMQHLKLNWAWSSGSHLEHDVGEKTIHLSALNSQNHTAWLFSSGSTRTVLQLQKFVTLCWTCGLQTFKCLEQVKTNTKT